MTPSINNTICQSQSRRIIIVAGVLKGHVVYSSVRFSMLECGMKCTAMKPKCKSFNYIKYVNQSSLCEINNMAKGSALKDDFVEQTNSRYFEPLKKVRNYN